MVWKFERRLKRITEIQQSIEQYIGIDRNEWRR